jgi:hypothetical protein
MTVSLKTHTAIASLFAAVLSLSTTAQTPAPNTTEWENEALKLRLFYPSDLTKADTEQVMHDGHLALFGISGYSDPKLAEAANCLRPILLLELLPSPSRLNAKVEPGFGGGTRVTVTPTVSATILLAELDVNCLTPEQQKATTLLTDMAEVVTKVPGMKSIAQPSTYTIGWQKVHMAAAQGLPQSNPSDPQLSGQLPLYTMGISTNWNSHLLVWYFTSNNSIDTLNRITKITVRFGRDQAAPLYPLTIGNATPQP